MTDYLGVEMFLGKLILKKKETKQVLSQIFGSWIAQF